MPVKKLKDLERGDWLPCELDRHIARVIAPPTKGVIRGFVSVPIEIYYKWGETYTCLNDVAWTEGHPESTVELVEAPDVIS